MAEPIEKTRKGSISISIFDGQWGKTAVVQKSYKKKNSEEWVNNNINLFLNELKPLKEALDEIYGKFKEEIEKQKGE